MMDNEQTNRNSEKVKVDENVNIKKNELKKNMLHYVHCTTPG